LLPIIRQNLGKPFGIETGGSKNTRREECGVGLASVGLLFLEKQRRGSVKKTGTKDAICAAALLAFGFASLALQSTQVKASPARPQAPVAPEMDRLIKLYRGTWEYTEMYSKSISSPKGGENTGIYTSELGPGGMSLVNRFHSKGPVGDSEGLLVMTWDPKEKAYKAYVFGNDFPGALVETGQFEGDTLIFRASVNMGEKSIPIRNETRVDGKGVLTSDEFFGTSAPDTKDTPFVHVTATRKP
jgi:hypothetical protein